MKSLNEYLVGCVGLVCAVASMSASAELVPRSYAVNATGNCNGALPSFEGALRKRPTAIANEGTSSAFISCSLPGDQFNIGNYVLYVAFNNRSAVPVSFTCTFVDGYAPGFSPEPVYYPQTIEIEAGSPAVPVWEPANGEVFSNNANVSCALPPGVDINLLVVSFNEDNGVESP